MLTLNLDPTFQYELLRTGMSRDRSADIGEVLRIAPEIVPGDFEDWYEHFDGCSGRGGQLWQRIFRSKLA